MIRTTYNAENHFRTDRAPGRRPLMPQLLFVTGVARERTKRRATLTTVAAISPASRAFPTIRSRFARSVRPSLSRCRYERTNGVTAWPCTLFGRGLGERPLDQRLDVVEALVGRTRRASSPPPPSSQCAAASRAASSADSIRADTGGPPRGGVEERQRVGPPAEHRNPERLEELGRRRHVEQRLDAGRDDERPASRASARRSAETSGGFGQPRCTPPRPPVAMNLIPPLCRRRACRRPSSRRRRPGRPPRRGRAARASAPRRRTGRARSRSGRSRARRRARRSSPARRRPREPPARTRGRPRRLRRAESRARRASSPERRRRGPPREPPRPRRAKRITASLRAARSSARPPRARAPGRRRGSLRRARRRRRSCRRPSLATAG